ncbi:MAG TPA: T9SS type A sorting domain-containing protein [Bacteroidia bacterium]|nr:T9SS type A sorting domain-containing protein [Bacteroidia bacterium]
MKKLLISLLIFPSLLFGNVKGNFHSQLAFEQNAGQVVPGNETGKNVPDIRFVLRAGNLAYYFSDRGYSVVQKNKSGIINRTDFFFQHERTCFVPAYTKIIPEGENEIQANRNYYLPGGKITPHQFRKIIYRNVYNGNDLEFSIDGDNLVRKLIVNNADLNAAILSFDVKGSSLEEIPTGGYTFSSDAGTFSEKISGENQKFRISDMNDYDFNDTKISEPKYWIERNNSTDQTQSSSISWLTYLGGSSAEDLFGITLAPDNGVVVTGRTGSSDFPVTAGSMQDTLSLSYDAVVTRFDKNGNCLWSTYYGGTNFDGANQIVTIDSTFVIAGMTSSTDLPMLYPTQATNNGSYDAFLLVLDGAGQMIRSTYYGGSGGDQGLCIAKGPANEIVLAGSATSTDLPYASSGFQGTMGGQIDAFLAVFDDSLNVQWSTYYGGANPEDIHAICVTPQGEIAFVGGTRSNNFPVTANAWQAGLLNQPDNYLVKFGMDGSRHYATFFGGTNNEDANGIVSDADGNLYMTGFTYSADFPTQGNVFQSNLQGQNDVYVSKFDVNGQLVWSTFVGGGGQDVAWAMYGLGKYIFVCGETESPAFPVSTTAIQATYASNGDGFVIKMDTSGQMVSGTFMGGNGVDALLAITVDADTSVITCGDTYSTDLPVANAFQSTNATAGDGYVLKFGMSEELPLSFSSVNADHSISLFPNPSDGNISVSTQKGIIVKVDIVDMLGKLLICEHENAETVSLNVSDLSRGIYFLKVTDENSCVHVIRFIRN